MNNTLDYIIWDINESEDELRAQLQHPEYFADKVARLKPGSKRMLEVLAVRCALKHLMNGEEQKVLYDEHGAPYLEGGPFLSISHTNGFAAVVVDEKDKVGIDIERLGTRVQRVVERYLTNSELLTLQLAAERCDWNCRGIIDPMDLCLHLAWSAKEAAYKVLGPDYYDLQNLTQVTHIDWLTHHLALSVANRPKPLSIRIEATMDYVLAVCSGPIESRG
ncbi:MAG: 4'-phosphopantetheinyl transferase superfamily protein [Bacteroidales bacterium]|nr:4'-phosphopantetheinyl transferase superfamily protein [Bacteroidales bacterium]